jgi:archaellum component FlaG (FlaF/FlaG flagellin family)
MRNSQKLSLAVRLPHRPGIGSDQDLAKTARIGWQARKSRPCHASGDVAKKIALPLTALMTILACSASPASATTPSAAWSIRTIAEPTNFAPNDSTGTDVYRVLVTNTGSLPSDGSPVTITDTLPGAVSVQSVRRFEWVNAEEHFSCTKVTTPIQCTFNTAVPAGEVLELDITVATEPGASGILTNTATVTGGAAAEASTTTQNPVSAAPAPFTLSDFSFGVDGVNGMPDTQAGDHPYAVTTSLDFTTESLPSNLEYHEPAENIKDAVVELPLGLVGNPQAAPKCPLSKLELDETGSFVQCPADTKIGEVTLDEPVGFASSLLPNFGGQFITSASSLYNLVPEHGHPAEFGFDYAGLAAAILYPSVVRTEAGYVLRVTTPNAPSEFAFPEELGFVSGFSLTLFGDPAKHAGTDEAPFFTNPSDCSPRGLTATIHVDTWTHPATMTNADGTPDLSDSNWLKAESSLPPVAGCDALQFNPELAAQPESTRSDSPTGLTVDLKVPQAPTNDAALATPDLKTATVTLPTGMSLSPSSANGLQACSPAQISLEDNSRPTCPEASKIGTVELTTPLLANPIGGSVYLAEQGDNPFGSLIALYIVVDDPATGTLIKLAGHGELGDGTNGLALGQVRTTFANNPQLPFNELKLQLKEGARAPLTTPQTCGTYTTTSSLTPWSAPGSGPAASPSSSFKIGSGPNGEPCAPQGFAPSFSAGTVSNQAGAFSPFTLTLSRTDADQDLGGLAVTTPPGLLGMLSRVQLCQEPQANLGMCPAASQIGHVTVGAGPGPDPVYVPQPGKPQDPAYLTGSYKGAPFGLSVVVPAEAGPFHLGTVVVRSAITVDPHTGQVTITSDPFPTVLQGIPLQIKTVNVTVDRPGFIFNPTNCDPLSVGGTIVSTQDTQVGVSSHFQAANCANLPFKPSFTASTQGKTSKADGASLVVKVAQKPGEANIHRIDLTLPKILPARLTTLQKACIEAQFNANPAGCPAASLIGTAKAVTPVLNVPLTGPAYLVSHGGAAFPDVELVLQGEGVEIVLDGRTDIKKGITYSRFETVPDAPISSFETKLPEGSHSALTANGNLCATAKTVSVHKRVTVRVHGRIKHVTKTVKEAVAQPLTMPTTITGQNGAVLTQATKIGATGCSKAKKKAKKQAKRRQ